MGALAPEDAEVFFALSKSLFAVIDRDGTVLRLSATWEDLLGFPLADLTGKHFTDLLHPEDVEPTLQRLVLAEEPEPHGLPALENRFRRADGGSVWLRWDTHPARDGSQVWSIARDVTADRRRRQQQRVVADLGRTALEGATLETLLEATAQGVASGLEVPHVAVAQRVPGTDDLVLRATVGLVDAGGQPVAVPPGRATVAGRAIASGQPQVLVDTGDADAHYPESLRAFGLRSVVAVPIGSRGSVWGALSAGGEAARQFEPGEVRFVEQVAHVLSSALDRREAEERLEHQATHDSLTGLPNRELLRERLEAALADSRRGGAAVGLLLCDLDGFKDVNDSLGHAAGDAVLQQLAERLRATVGPGSTVARLGGDEFALCVVGPATELEVLGVADTVVALMHKPFQLPGLQVPLSTSIGVAVSPTHGRDAATMLRHADVAMYRAKSLRSGWALYDARLDAASGDRLTLTTELRDALTHGRLQVVYQPVVDLETGHLQSVEALCRWPHPVRGQVPPSEFVPLAEQTGLIASLTSWVIAEVDRQALAWEGAGHRLRCAVNLSMAAVADEQRGPVLLAQLAAAAPRLSVEITEWWLADTRGRPGGAELAAAGVELALDDFGTGWSSLASLRSFPVSRLKLDRHFVADLEGDARSGDLLSAVASLAAALRMDVVAEGVEQRGTADALRAAGVRLGQGFLWAPGLPADELARWAGWA